MMLDGEEGLEYEVHVDVAGAIRYLINAKGAA